jgi:NAD+ diphosphatase
MFIFQGNSILLPADSTGETNEISCDEFNKFRESNDGLACDEFEIPSLTDSLPIHVVNIPPLPDIPSGFRSVTVRERLPLLSICGADNGAAGRLLRAFHIAQWRGESLFCGACGAKNTDSTDELARLCPACGRLEYPRIAPAMIVLVTNDKDQVLLAHNKKFTPTVYSLIAGFNEAGESLESTVQREVREEVSIEVTDIRYITSQPWPFPNSLMLGFSARHASGEIRADNVEIEDARWWNRDTLPTLPGAASVSRYLINRWLDSEQLPSNR